MPTWSPQSKAMIRDAGLDTLWIGVPGIALFLLLRHLFPINVVATPSMEPTIRAGERVLVNTLSQNPQRGSLVQFDSGFRYGLGDREPVNFVKRVVAVPGDTVAIEAGRLVVNGAVVEEDYPTVTTEDYPTVEVPVDHYFVLGDNRAESYDSRFLGPIPEGRIQGRAYVIP